MHWMSRGGCTFVLLALVLSSVILLFSQRGGHFPRFSLTFGISFYHQFKVGILLMMYFDAPHSFISKMKLTMTSHLLCILFQTFILMIEATNVIPIDVINYYCPSLSIQSNATISDLYGLLNTAINLDHAISIIFNERVLLNLVNDDRNITTFGISAQSNAIQIIKKPDYVALLEMVSEIKNIGNIPWFNQAMECLSDPSANHCDTILKSEHVFRYDPDGNLIKIDVSNLKLIGTIRMLSLPQSVRVLDLSFNDLYALNLDELKGKTLKRLNVHHNDRIHISTECFYEKPGYNLPIRVLRLSSNQILPWISNPVEKYKRLKEWFFHRDQRTLNAVVMDGAPILLRKQMALKVTMLKVIENVSNKALIPWFDKFNDDRMVQEHQWPQLGVKYRRCRGPNSKTAYKFDLSGLGLEGHVDLGQLSPQVIAINLSNNNLSSISLIGHGDYSLKEINLENNKYLRIDLMQIHPLLKLSCLCVMNRLTVSSYQLGMGKMAIMEWLCKSTLNEIVVDKYVMRKRTCVT